MTEEISPLDNSDNLALVPTLLMLLKQTLAGVYIIQNGKFSYVNQSFARIFGYDDPNELLNSISVFDLVAADCRDRVAENVQRRLSGVNVDLEYSFTGIKKDGTQIEVEVHGSRTDHAGKPAIVGILLDVTENKRMQSMLIEHERELETQVENRTEELNNALEQLRESEERYRVQFSQSKVPMLLIDPDNGQIVDANSAAAQYYGYSHTALLDKRIHDINQLSSAELDQELISVKESKCDHFFFVHKLADGSLRDVEVHTGPLKIGKRQLLYSIIHDITERRAAERSLKELNRDFVTFLENTSDFVYFKDQDSRFRFCSQTLAKITHHDSWRDLIGKHDQEVFPPDTAKVYEEEELSIFQQGTPLLNKTDPYYKEDGSEGWVNTNKWPVFDDSGDKVIGLFGISRDVTEKQEAEETLKVAASVFENAREGILITNADGTVIEVNRAFCDISGYSREEILYNNPSLLKSGHHDQQFFAQMWDSLALTGFWQGEIWNRRKDGSLFACRTSINAIRDELGNVNRYIGLHSDITEFLRHHEQVEHMAYYDALTDLPNRVLLKDRMSQAMAMTDRIQTTLAVCFLDLDMFKPINDRFGHKAGDLLLIEIARRLIHSVRLEDTVARLGGDEFALFLTHLSGKEHLIRLLERIISAISEPFALSQGEKVSVSASLGVCLYPSTSRDGDQLLKLADKAMYEAKELGRNQYRICQESGSEDQLIAVSL